MFENFSWFLRDCAIRDYKIWSETEGEISTRAYYRSLRFLAVADLLHPTFAPFDIEDEYQCRYNHNEEC